MNLEIAPARARRFGRAAAGLVAASLVAIADAGPPFTTAGDSTTIAVRADGTVVSWGDDRMGQLGSGRPLAVLQPTALPSLAGSASIFVNHRSFFALKDDGSVWAWGDNRFGELGLGADKNVVVPTRISFPQGIRSLAHLTALAKDGTVWTWGHHSVRDQQRLFNGGATPVQVAGLNDVTSIADGLALRSDGTVWTWGRQPDESDASYRDPSSPVRIPELSDVVAIASEFKTRLALTRDGSVWSWGANGSGQLGDGSRIDRATPIRIDGPKNIVAIVATAVNGFALQADGKVWAWGNNASAQIGDGTTVTRLSPVMLTGISNVVGIYPGMFTDYGLATYAVKSDGTAWAWGLNAFGQLGDGTTTSRASPGQVIGLTAVRSISSGYSHALALRADGTVWAWGNDSISQLGDRLETTKVTPPRLLASPLATVANARGVASSVFSSLALTSDGRVLVWGDNTDSFLQGGVESFRSVPQSVSGLSKVVSVDAKANLAAATTADGSVWSWGSVNRSVFDALLNGTPLGTSVPSRAPGIPNGLAVAAGCDHFLALAGDGALWAWGQNKWGQLGDGSTTAQEVPVRVLGLNGMTSVSAGCGFSMALRSDGTVWTWGLNDRGQLGGGSNAPQRITPGLVGGVGAVSTVAAGHVHALAGTSSGEVWSWGGNDSGQLGDGTRTDSAAPKLVTKVPSISSLSAGTDHSLVLSGDGYLSSAGYGWAFFDGTDNGSRVSFTRSPAPFEAGAVAAGSRHSVLLMKDGGVRTSGLNYMGQLGDGTLAANTYAALVRREGGLGSIEANNWLLDLRNSQTAGSGSAVVPPFLVTASERSALTATVQFRQRDINTTGSVFLFALVPTALVKREEALNRPVLVGTTRSAPYAKQSPTPCALAQMDSKGELHQVSLSQLQPYFSGVLSAQGQSVAILGLANPSLAGATVYVGYGATPAAMIADGLNRGILNVAGAAPCLPQRPQTGWWWNPAESGRGFSIESSGNNMFVATYLYDVSGRSTWYVAGGPASLDGSIFSAQLLSFGGGTTMGGTYRSNSRRDDQGSLLLVFADSQHATLVWPGGTAALQRFGFGARGPDTDALPEQPESGWWWGGPGDSGRGLFIEWQGNRAFVAGYMYDEFGNPVWYVADGQVANPRTFSGNWQQYANGQSLNGAYKAPSVINGNVAPVTIQFEGATAGVLTLPSGNMPITRFRF